MAAKHHLPPSADPFGVSAFQSVRPKIITEISTATSGNDDRRRLNCMLQQRQELCYDYSVIIPRLLKIKVANMEVS